jgi:tetratricopeptide (TPR) repeat protein
MGKTSRPSSLNIIDASDEWTSHPAVEWLSANKQIILWGFLALLLLLIGAYRFISHSNHQAENDYYRAETVFAQFQKETFGGNEESAAASLKELEAIIERHPELKAKYEGQLAQDLLIAGKAVQATPLAEEVFKRTLADAIQLYQDYSVATLLISENQYEKALQQTQQLQQHLSQFVNEKSFENLFAYNFLRLAMLHQQLGHSEEELKVWETIESLPINLKNVLESTQGQTFNQGKGSLADYINQRKKALKTAR